MTRFVGQSLENFMRTPYGPGWALVDDADYHHERDRRSLPFYQLTTQLAPLEPLPDELAHLLAAVQGNQEAMDQFARVGGAVMSPADFFSDENVGRILARS